MGSQRMATAENGVLLIELTGRAYTLPTIGNVSTQCCPSLPVRCYFLGGCPLFFFVEMTCWVFRIFVKLLNVLWVFKRMLIDMPALIRKSTMLNGTPSPNKCAIFVNTCVASTIAMLRALLAALTKLGADIVSSILDLMAKILALQSCLILCEKQSHESTIHVGQCASSMPNLQCRETIPLRTSLGYLPSIPTKQMAQRHAFGFTGAYPTHAWRNKEFSEAIHNLVHHREFEQWNLQTIAEQIRSPTVFKVCLSYQHRTHLQVNKEGEMSLKIPVEEWIHATKYIAKGVAGDGFSMMMIWWDQIFCGRTQLDDLESSGKDLATHGLEPYITYPVAILEPATSQIPIAKPIGTASPNQSGGMANIEISGPPSTEERMWTSLEMIGGMIGMGLAGATPQADGMLNSEIHNGVASSWLKLRQETVGEYEQKVDDDEPRYAFVGKGLVHDNAALALAVLAIKTGQFFKKTSSQEDAKALFRWAKNMVLSTAIGLNSIPEENLEKGQNMHPKGALTKAIALMGSVGNANMERLWQLQQEAHGSTCFQPKWDALKSLHWPEGGFSLEPIADKSGHVVIFDVGAETKKAIANYPKGSKIIIAMWQSGIEGIPCRSMQLYMTILKDAWETPWLPKEGLVVLKKIGTPHDELELVRPSEIYSWLKLQQRGPKFSRKLIILHQHMLEMVNEAVATGIAETSITSQMNNVEVPTIGKKIKVITTGDASELCRLW